MFHKKTVNKEEKTIWKVWNTLLKAFMHYKSSFNALIMPCNASYNALYNLMNNCNHI